MLLFYIAEKDYSDRLSKQAEQVADLQLQLEQSQADRHKLTDQLESKIVDNSNRWVLVKYLDIHLYLIHSLIGSSESVFPRFLLSPRLQTNKVLKFRSADRMNSTGRAEHDMILLETPESCIMGYSFACSKFLMY